MLGNGSSIYVSILHNVSNHVGSKNHLERLKLLPVAKTRDVISRFMFSMACLPGFPAFKTSLMLPTPLYSYPLPSGTVSEGKKNVCNPRAKLLDVVKRRAQALAMAGPSKGALEALMRLATVELKRGLYDDAVNHFEPRLKVPQNKWARHLKTEKHRKGVEGHGMEKLVGIWWAELSGKDIHYFIVCDLGER